MNIKGTLLGIGLAIFASAGHAAVVDFESVATDQFSDSITADGFDWDFSASGWFIGPHDSAFHPDGTSNGTSNLVAAGDRNQDTARVTMTMVGGGTFSIGSLDAATANLTETNRLGITGFLLGGGSITTYLGIDGSFDSYLLAGFVNLTSALFFSENSGDYNFGGFSIDNINSDVSAIPVPASLPLFLVAIGGLGVASRRRKKAA